MNEILPRITKSCSFDSTTSRKVVGLIVIKKKCESRLKPPKWHKHDMVMIALINKQTIDQYHVIVMKTNWSIVMVCWIIIALIFISMDSTRKVRVMTHLTSFTEIDPCCGQYINNHCLISTRTTTSPWQIPPLMTIVTAGEIDANKQVIYLN